MKIAFVMMSNNPRSFFDYFASIESLLSISYFAQCHDVELLIAAQQPWNNKLIDMAAARLSNFNIKLLSKIVPQENPASGFRLRSSAALLSRNADYYIIIDDNHKFAEGTPQYPYSSSVRYLEALDYMQVYNSCGAVNCCGAFGGHNHKRQIKNYTGYFTSTERGILIRNVFEGDIMPDFCKHADGTFEDCAVSIKLIENGYFIAKQFNNPTQHKEKERIDCADTSAIYTAKQTNFNLHNPDVNAKNFIALFMKRYKVPFAINAAKVPALMLERYLENSGDINMLMVKNSAIIDYGSV